MRLIGQKKFKGEVNVKKQTKKQVVMSSMSLLLQLNFSDFIG